MAVCLGDLRRRRGFFERYPPEEPLDLVAVINCAGCPTIGAAEKILERVKSVAEFNPDAIHLSFCMSSLCPFRDRYAGVVREYYPGIEVVMGTHTPKDPRAFQLEVKELLCVARRNMTDLIKSRPTNRHLFERGGD
jgi:predicted metal-binding protein